MGTLITHRGAQRVSLDDLEKIPTPKATRTFTPIPHHVLVKKILAEIKDAGMHVSRQQYALHADTGNTLFGVLDLKSDIAPDWSPSFGFRTANNRKMALRAVAGLRVFVCDNLALSGDEIVLRRRHTGLLDIDAELRVAVERFAFKSNQLAKNVDAWKEEQISYNAGRSFLYDVFSQKMAPTRIFPVAAREWSEPSYPEFAENGHTAWRLLNAFTTAAKELRIGETARVLNRVGSFFQSKFAPRNGKELA